MNIDITGHKPIDDVHDRGQGSIDVSAWSSFFKQNPESCFVYHTVLATVRRTSESKSLNVKAMFKKGLRERL